MVSVENELGLTRFAAAGSVAGTRLVGKAKHENGLLVGVLGRKDLHSQVEINGHHRLAESGASLVVIPPPHLSHILPKLREDMLGLDSCLQRNCLGDDCNKQALCVCYRTPLPPHPYHSYDRHCSSCIAEGVVTPLPCGSSTTEAAATPPPTSKKRLTSSMYYLVPNHYAATQSSQTMTGRGSNGLFEGRDVSKEVYGNRLAEKKPLAGYVRHLRVQQPNTTNTCRQLIRLPLYHNCEHKPPCFTSSLCEKLCTTRSTSQTSTTPTTCSPSTASSTGSPQVLVGIQNREPLCYLSRGCSQRYQTPFAIPGICTNTLCRSRSCSAPEREGTPQEGAGITSTVNDQILPVDHVPNISHSAGTVCNYDEGGDSSKAVVGSMEGGRAIGKGREERLTGWTRREVDCCLFNDSSLATGRCIGNDGKFGCSVYMCELEATERANSSINTDCRDKHISITTKPISSTTTNSICNNNTNTQPYWNKSVALLQCAAFPAVRLNVRFSNNDLSSTNNGYRPSLPLSNTTTTTYASSGLTSSLLSNACEGNWLQTNPYCGPTSLLYSPNMGSDDHRDTVDAAEYLKHRLASFSSTLTMVCFNFAEMCRVIFKQLDEADDLEGNFGRTTCYACPPNKTTSRQVFSKTAGMLVVFLSRYRIHEEDIVAVLCTSFSYLESLSTANLQPLLRQMVNWFDASNVLYFLAFLAHVFVLDDTIPLKCWGQRLSEGVAKGSNVNKCVRNLLKMRKYRLDVNPDTYNAAFQSLHSYNNAFASAMRV